MKPSTCTDGAKDQFPMRWSSPNSKNHAVTTLDGKNLFLRVDGKNYYFTRRRITKAKRSRR
jgi:hypothetical protein